MLCTTPRPRTPLAVLAAGLSATLLALALPAAAAPPLPVRPSAIEPLAGYVAQSTCSPTTKPGTAALRSLVHAAYPATGDLGIVRDCAIGGTSEHKEGRAWDWAVNAYSTTQDAAAKDMFAWLFASDRDGNTYAMARRLGIMYMIYNEHIWSASSASAGWRPYTGPNPHTDHVHISLSWAGADKTTSYWVPAAATSPVAAAPTGAFLAEWTGLGGAAGTLGAPLGADYAVAGGRAQDFAYGRIYSSATLGTHALYGAIHDRFLAAGGVPVLGLPVSDESAVPGGRATAFERGRILWSVGTGAHVVHGLIGSYYDAQGGPGSYLGLPTADESAVPGDGRVSSFEHGRVYWSPTTGTHAVHGLVGAHYDALGGPAGTLGLPTSDEVDVPGGRANSFDNGAVYWSPATGASSVQGLIYDHYIALGGAKGYLGMPKADEADVPGGRVSSFAAGRIYWSGPTGAAEVHGLIGARYDALGGPRTLGLPTADEQDAAGLGRVSPFTGGDVYWSPTGGTAVVTGVVLAHYAANGGPAGFLGMPRSDLEPVVTGLQQQVFAGGRVYLGGGTAHNVRGAICDRYVQLGGPTGPLGAPRTDEYDVPGGRRSEFWRGSLTWNAGTGQVTSS